MVHKQFTASWVGTNAASHFFMLNFIKKFISHTRKKKKKGERLLLSKEIGLKQSKFYGSLHNFHWDSLIAIFSNLKINWLLIYTHTHKYVKKNLRSQVTFNYVGKMALSKSQDGNKVIIKLCSSRTQAFNPIVLIFPCLSLFFSPLFF